MITPTLKPTVERARPEPSLKGLEHLAWLMDRAFRVPGTNITVGLDAILGLLPVGGDVLTGLIQAGIVLVALVRYRVPRPIAARMAANVLLDVALGSIPILGDAFDAFFKANTRNMELLHQVQEQRQLGKPATPKTPTLTLVLIGAALLAVLALVLIGFVTVVGWLIHRPLV